jgi:hypothetical protein
MNGSVTPKPSTDGNQPIRICAESIYLQRYVKSSLNSPSAHYCTEKPGDAPNSTISPDKWSCSYRAAEDGAALCSRFHMVAAREIAGDLAASWLRGQRARARDAASSSRRCPRAKEANPAEAARFTDGTKTHAQRRDKRVIKSRRQYPAACRAQKCWRDGLCLRAGFRTLHRPSRAPSKMLFL